MRVTAVAVPRSLVHLSSQTVVCMMISTRI